MSKSAPGSYTPRHLDPRHRPLVPVRWIILVATGVTLLVLLCWVAL